MHEHVIRTGNVQCFVESRDYFWLVTQLSLYIHSQNPLTVYECKVLDKRELTAIW